LFDSAEMERIKRIVKRTPVVRDLARFAMRQIAARTGSGFDSAAYWESRYRKGRNSGPGSYNRLAEFKAEILNRFVEDHDIHSVIEFGSGDGSQLLWTAFPHYVGVDVSRTAIEETRKLFDDDASKSFIHIDDLTLEHKAELSLSLDVIYHLVEDNVFERYMSQLFDSATRYVIVYSSNDNRAPDSPHVRHRKFTDWVERRPDFHQCDFLANPYPFDPCDIDNSSFADFYFFERSSDADPT
jgi:hypothetical protein